MIHQLELPLLDRRFAEIGKLCDCRATQDSDMIVTKLTHADELGMLRVRFLWTFIPPLGSLVVIPLLDALLDPSKCQTFES